MTDSLIRLRRIILRIAVNHHRLMREIHLLKIYYLPMRIVLFLRAAHHPDYKDTWNALVGRGRERPKPPKNKQKAQGEDKKRVEDSTPRQARNYFYEDIFRLPEDARRFVRMYLLRVPKQDAKGRRSTLAITTYARRSS